jgi:hypothetical protein
MLRPCRQAEADRGASNAEPLQASGNNCAKLAEKEGDKTREEVSLALDAAPGPRSFADYHSDSLLTGRVVIRIARRKRKQV